MLRRRPLYVAGITLVWVVLGSAVPSPGQPPVREFLCRAGSRHFDGESQNGIKVHVGAAKSGGLATRSCAASLTWEKQELIVSAAAAEIDLDAFGIDLGDGVPVAAFQIRHSDSDCCADY